MPATPPPQVTPQKNNKKMSPALRFLRTCFSFLVGLLFFILLIIISGNKTASQILDMIKSIFV